MIRYILELSERVKLLLAATLMLTVPYVFHVVHHFVDSKGLVSSLDMDNTPAPLRVLIESPRAMYVGVPGRVSIDVMSPMDTEPSSWETISDNLTKNLTCRLDAPGYDVVALSRCRYMVSPKMAGTPMLVASIYGVRKPGPPRPGHLMPTVGPAVRPIHVPFTIPVDASLGTSLSTISTFLGIMTAVAGLFFKQNDAQKVEDTATQRLLNDIRKKRKRNG
jgi:hypothetical protein